MERTLVKTIGSSTIYEESHPNGRGGWTFIGYRVLAPLGDRQFPDRASAEAYARLLDLEWQERIIEEE